MTSWCKKCTRSRWDDSEFVQRRNKKRRERRANKLYREQEYATNKSRILNSRVTRIKYLVTSAKARAKKKDMVFTITYEDINPVDRCPLLGVQLTWTKMDGKLPTAPSIDRVNPNKGYEKGNVWIVSEKANRMKAEATMDELLTFAKNIQLHWEH